MEMFIKCRLPQSRGNCCNGLMPPFLSWYGTERLGAQGLVSWRQQGWGGTQGQSAAATRRGSPAWGFPVGHRVRRCHTAQWWWATALSPRPGYVTSWGACAQSTSMIRKYHAGAQPQHFSVGGCGSLAPQYWPLGDRPYTESEGFPGSTVLLHCKRAWCGPPARTGLQLGWLSFHSTAVNKGQDMGSVWCAFRAACIVYPKNEKIIQGSSYL